MRGYSNQKPAARIKQPAQLMTKTGGSQAAGGHPLLTMQRKVGNQAVMQLKPDAMPPIQRMDIEEEELQMKQDSSAPLQRMGIDEEEELQA